MAALVIAALLAGASGCRDIAEPRSAGNGKAGAAPLVEAVEARWGSLPLEERLSGVVKARNQVALHPEIEAPVAEVLVRNGDRVKRGQPLVRLRAEGLAEQLRQAEAALRLAEAAAKEARAELTELEAQVVRSRALAREKLVSDVELEIREAQLAAAEANRDQAEARVQQNRALLEERRWAVDRTVVRAPIAGRVGRRQAEVGMLVSPNTVLFLIGDLDRLIVEIPLTERMLSYIREGQPVRIRAKGLGDASIDATLLRISPFLAQGSFSTTAEIDIANPDDRLRPGMFVTVDVLYGKSREATLVPVNALWEDPGTGELAVFVVQAPDGSGPGGSAEALPAEPLTVERRAVDVVAEGRAAAGIGGVEPSEWVVTVGQDLLAGEKRTTAKVRPATWERVVALQRLQREDLLENFLSKQQRLARTHGAKPPTNEEFLGPGAAAALPSEGPQ